MYIRFTERPLKNGILNTVRAELIHSYRDRMTGRPHTKVVAYLGSLRQVWNGYPKARLYALQERFWGKADKVFARLEDEGKLDESEVTRLKAKVEERFPRPPHPSITGIKGLGTWAWCLRSPSYEKLISMYPSLWRWRRGS